MKNVKTTSKTAATSLSSTPMDLNVLNSIARRAHYLATRMIYEANHRDDKEKAILKSEDTFLRPQVLYTSWVRYT